MTVTIKDIAKKIGISSTTVSRALNNLDLVNPETRTLVQETAKSMGYTPNLSAISLKLQRTNTIGLFFSTYENLTSAMVLNKVFTAIYDQVKNDYNVLVKSVEHQAKNSLNPHLLDGIILVSQKASDQAFVEEAIGKSIPIVLINQKFPLAVDTVLIDELDAGYRMMRYLLDMGHRKIAVLEGPTGLYSTKQRHEGWQNALRDYKIDAQTIPVFRGNFRVESGVEIADKILKKKPTALLSFNDEMAFGVQNVMASKGLKVPEDMSIIGFDNWEVPLPSVFGITTIERDMYSLTREASNMLLDRINNNKTKSARTIFLEGPLVMRNSVLDLREKQV